MSSPPVPSSFPLSSESDLVLTLKVTAESGGSRLIGACIQDSAARRFDVAQFLDNDRFDQLRSLLSMRAGYRECYYGFDVQRLIPTDQNKILDILAENQIPVIELKFNEFRHHDPQDEISKHIPDLPQQIQFLERVHGLSALLVGALKTSLFAAEAADTPDAAPKYRLFSLDLSDFLYVDSAAKVALNLFRAPSDSSPDMNLYGLLNKCKTQMGQRLLKDYLLQPLRNLTKINERLDLVEFFFDNLDCRQSLRDDKLKKIPDLERIIRNFQRKRANLQALVALYGFAKRLPGIWAQIRENSSGKHEALLHSQFIEPLGRAMENLAQFEALVESTVDLNSVDSNHEYCVRPDFDPNLVELHRKKSSLWRAMEEIAAEASDECGVNVKLNEGIHDWALKVTRKDEKALRNKRNYQQLDTKKDGVRFTTNDLKRLSKEYQSACQLYQKAQDEIVKQAISVAASYTPVLESANELIARLDVLLAFAHVAATAPAHYVRPNILPASAGKLDLIQARHPMLEVQPGTHFIPNDIRMEKGKSNIQIITGINMGGKSVYIRQTGVITLMAHIGCFVPCDSATISVCDSILARVGAGDLQIKGVSTFMKEMLEAASIVQTASPNSLVIIDELGRGTSTYDGFGVAWAIAEHIGAKIGAFTMFATHFHELTKLSDIQPCVKNRHVTAEISDADSITMLYQVKDGPADRSFGVPVAKLAHFPSSVVEMAKRKAEELESFGAETAEELAGKGTDNGKRFKRMALGENASKRISAPKRDEVNQFLADLSPEERVNSETNTKSLIQELNPRAFAVADALEEAFAA